MRSLFAIAAAGCVAAAGAAEARQITVEAAFSVLGQRFIPSNDFDDVSDGFLAVNDEFNYDDALADAELRDLFDNPDLPYGGGYWDGNENVWILPPENLPFDEVRVRLTFDDAAFSRDNVVGNDFEQPITAEPVQAEFEAFSDGSFFGGVAFDTTLTGANDDPAGSGGSDFVAVGAVVPSAATQLDAPEDEFLFGIVGPDDWFESLPEDGNALDDAGLHMQAVFVKEAIFGVGEDGTEYGFGTLEFQATLDGPISVTVLGESEEAPLLPNDLTDEGGFEFVVTIEDLSDPDGAIWIDPIIATGYEYDIGGEIIAGVVAPSTDVVPQPDGSPYIVTVLVNGSPVTFELLPGESLSFADEGLLDVTSFTLTGIDESLMLDPQDPLAFSTGIIPFASSGRITLTQTPILTEIPEVGEVPLPLPGALLLGGLGGMALLRRRRGAAA